MKIIAVNKVINDNNEIGYEVEYELNDRKYIDCFNGDYWLEKDSNGKEKFINRIQDNINKINTNKQKQQQKEKISKYDGVEYEF